MASGVELKQRVHPLPPIKGRDFLRVLGHALQHGISRFALPAPQRKVDALRQTASAMRQDVFPHAGKPQRAGHAGRAGKDVGCAQGVDGKQPRHGIAGNPPPSRRAGKLPFREGDDFLRQEPQVLLRAAGEGAGARKGGRRVPGRHVAVPVKVGDSHQRKVRTACLAQGAQHALPLPREGVEIEHRGVWLPPGKKADAFALCLKGVKEHYGSPPLSPAARPLVRAAFDTRLSLYPKEGRCARRQSKDVRHCAGKNRSVARRSKGPEKAWLSPLFSFFENGQSRPFAVRGLARGQGCRVYLIKGRGAAFSGLCPLCAAADAPFLKQTPLAAPFPCPAPSRPLGKAPSRHPNNEKRRPPP